MKHRGVRASDSEREIERKGVNREAQGAPGLEVTKMSHISHITLSQVITLLAL